MFVYTSNFIDRTILATLGQAIKLDLKITDAQLGLLQGIAFALFYTILGIPVARLADRFSRVNILTVCLVVWSGMTALCGVAANFPQLLLFRFGVGVGEAGCSPSAQSLIADYYPPQKRSAALSIYSFGIPLGAMIGAVSGGWIAEHMSWRIAFFIVGVPGLILAVITKLFLREPARGCPETAGAAGQTGAALDADGGAARKLLERNVSFVHITAGATLISFVGYGVGGFSQPYFIRNFHLGLAQVGLVFGIISGVSAGLGTLVGGFVTDWAGKRDRRWYAWVPGIGFLIALPFYVSAYLAPSWHLARVDARPARPVLLPPFGPDLRGAAQPGRAAAAGHGHGAALLHPEPDRPGRRPLFHRPLERRPDPAQFRAGEARPFLHRLPRRRGPKGGRRPWGPRACMGSSAIGVRWAILITFAFGAWGAAHYFLAARHIRSDMAKADASWSPSVFHPAACRARTPAMIPHLRPRLNAADIWSPQTRAASCSRSRPTPPTRWRSWAMIPKLAAQTIWEKGQRRDLRRRPDRRDRARDQARRYRLP